MTYERTVGKRLQRRIEEGDLEGKLMPAQWFRFEDENGRGYCQTDYYIICAGFIVLLECKLTQTQMAEGQMTELYVPILKHIYECPIICVQVFKNVRHKISNRLSDISILTEEPNHPKTGVWNWHYIP